MTTRLEDLEKVLEALKAYRVERNRVWRLREQFAELPKAEKVMWAALDAAEANAARRKAECDLCDGEGTLLVFDIFNSAGVRRTCGRCGGTGKKEPDGAGTEQAGEETHG